ncbi:hypothetical protein L2E81_04700 [Planktothrix agardhii 1033]|nr:hypothetical protein [Planktothrix agardhii 1033]
MLSKLLMRLFLFLLLILGINCNSVHAQNLNAPPASPPASPPPLVIQDYNQVPETDKLVDIKSVNLNIRHDIRYATTNNFLKKKIYSVPPVKMKKQGFIPLITEWWHFDAPGWDKYGLLDIPLENIR